MTGPVRVEADVYYGSWRPDLDASLLYDALQGVLYVNDRQVVEQVTRRFVDAARPRVELVVSEVEHPGFPARMIARLSS